MPNVLSTSRVHRFSELRGAKHEKIIEHLGWNFRAEPDARSEKDLMELIEAGPPLHGILAGHQPFSRPVLRSLVESGRKIGVVPAISRDGVGYENIDVLSAKELGVQVSIATGVNARTVAQYTLGLVLCLTRGIHTQHQELKRGSWKPFLGTELSKKRVGVLGFGNVGKESVSLLLGICPRVTVYDPKFASDPMWVEQQQACLRHLSTRGKVTVATDCAQIYETCDLIVLHASSTSQNHNLLNREVLSTCKRGVLIVNAARGELVDSEDMAAALRSGQVGAFATDVYKKEPVPPEDPLFYAPNTLLTAHSASMTEQNRPLQTVRALRNLRAMIEKHGTVDTLVC
ncbi:MAG: NAD(P)-dependent oxidoreductase [Bdellovibrionota bacterium]